MSMIGLRQRDTDRRESRHLPLVRIGDLGRLVREGKSRLYEHGHGQLLRTFDRPLATVQREILRSREARAAGLPAVEVSAQPLRLDDGSFGIVLASADMTLASLRLKSHPEDSPRIFDALARLLGRVHDAPAWESLPYQHEQMSARIASVARVSLRTRQQALRWLEELPGGDRVCHGGFQASEAFMSEASWQTTGWRNATRGNPAADLARSLLILADPGGKGGWLQRYFAIRQKNKDARRFIDCYREFTSNRTALEQLPRWLKICAVIRLGETRRDPSEIKRLLSIVER